MERLNELSREFRTGYALRAGLDLPAILEALAAEQARLHPTRLQQMVPILSAMVACQERQDWLGLADYIDGELLQVLGPRSDTSA